MSDFSSIAFSFVTFDYIIACNTHSRYLEYEKKKKKNEKRKKINKPCYPPFRYPLYETPPVMYQ